MDATDFLNQLEPRVLASSPLDPFFYFTQFEAGILYKINGEQPPAADRNGNVGMPRQVLLDYITTCRFMLMTPLSKRIVVALTEKS